MPNQIFGGGLNRNIDAKIQRLKQHTGCPVLSIIMMASGTTLRTAATIAGTSWTSMVMERRFQKHDFSVWLQMLNDIGTNQRIKPRCRYAQFAEDFATEILTRFIGGVGHQHMIALFDKSKNGISNRCRPAGNSTQPAPPSSSHIACCKEKWVNVPRRP